MVDTLGAYVRFSLRAQKLTQYMLRERIHHAIEVLQESGISAAVIALLASQAVSEEVAGEPEPNDSHRLQLTEMRPEMYSSIRGFRNRDNERARYRESHTRDHVQASLLRREEIERITSELRSFQFEERTHELSPRFVEEYYGNKYKNYDPFLEERLAQKALMRDQILEALFPEELQFLEDIFSSPIFHRSTSMEFWQSAKDDPDFILMLDFLISPAFRSWTSFAMERNKDSTYYGSCLFGDVSSLKMFVRHQNREQLMNVLKPDQLMREINELSGDSERDGKKLLFFLNFPDYIQVREELEPLETSAASLSVPWSERIRRFEKVSTALGTHGVKDHELSELIYSLWNPLNDSVSFRRIIDQLTTEQIRNLYTKIGLMTPELQEKNTSDLRDLLTQEEVYSSCQNNAKAIRALFLDVVGEKIYTFFRAGTSLETRLVLRDAIRKLKTQVGIPLYTSEEVRREIDYNESLYSPLTGLRPPFGNEIEYSPTVGIGMSPLELLHNHGFRKGYGGSGENNQGLSADAEYASGPFLTPQAAVTIHDLFVDSELFHVHQTRTIRTLHQSAGLRSIHIFSQWVRIMHTTGYCARPSKNKYTRAMSPVQSLYVHTDDGVIFSNGRLENKDFRYLTPRSYELHTEIGTPLLAGTLAYEKAIYSFKELNKEEIIRQKHEYFHQNPNEVNFTDDKIRISKAQIEALPLAPEQKALALVWRKLLIDYQTALDQIEAGSLLAKDVPREQADIIAKTILEVFPTEADHHNQDLPKNYTDGDHVYVNGATYPNIIAFSQERSFEAAERINAILGKAEVKVLHELERIAKITEKTKYQDEVLAFAKRFPWTMAAIPAQSNTYVFKHFNKLVVHASTFDKIEVKDNLSSI